MKSVLCKSIFLAALVMAFALVGGYGIGYAQAAQSPSSFRLQGWQLQGGGSLHPLGGGGGIKPFSGPGGIKPLGGPHGMDP